MHWFTEAYWPNADQSLFFFFATADAAKTLSRRCVSDINASLLSFVIYKADVQDDLKPNEINNKWLVVITASEMKTILIFLTSDFYLRRSNAG